METIRLLFNKHDVGYALDRSMQLQSSFAKFKKKYRATFMWIDLNDRSGDSSERQAYIRSFTKAIAEAVQILERLDVHDEYGEEDRKDFSRAIELLEATEAYLKRIGVLDDECSLLLASA